MATGLKALPFSFGAHFIALIAAIMVLVWSIHFRGGLAWEAENKNLIFNIHPVLMLIGFIILGGEAIISYKSFPLEKQVKKKNTSSFTCYRAHTWYNWNLYRIQEPQ